MASRPPTTTIAMAAPALRLTNMSTPPARHRTTTPPEATENTSDRSTSINHSPDNDHVMPGWRAQTVRHAGRLLHQPADDLGDRGPRAARGRVRAPAAHPRGGTGDRGRHRRRPVGPRLGACGPAGPDPGPVRPGVPVVPGGSGDRPRPATRARVGCRVGR